MISKNMSSAILHFFIIMSSDGCCCCFCSFSSSSSSSLPPSPHPPPPPNYILSTYDDADLSLGHFFSNSSSFQTQTRDTGSFIANFFFFHTNHHTWADLLGNNCIYLTTYSFFLLYFFVPASFFKIRCVLAVKVLLVLVWFDYSLARYPKYPKHPTHVCYYVYSSLLENFPWKLYCLSDCLCVCLSSGTLESSSPLLLSLCYPLSPSLSLSLFLSWNSLTSSHLWLRGVVILLPQPPDSQL